MPPLTLLIKPASSACNLRCDYCFYLDEVSHRADGDNGFMSQDTARVLISRALAFAQGELHFVFQGGEPTLPGAAFYQAWLKEVSRQNIKKLKVSYSLQTNGYALDEGLFKVLKAGNFLLGVSLDGTRELHDSARKTPDGHPTYDQVLSGLTKLQEQGIPYNILCVVTKELAERPEEVYLSLRRHGYLQFIPCLPALGEGGPFAPSALAYGRFLVALFDLYAADYQANRYVSIELFDNWIAMIRGFAPSACGLMDGCSPNFVVESGGEVYPCDFYALDEWRLGNLHTASLAQLARSARMQAFLSSSIPLPPACQNCAWLYLCRGGCRRERQTGILDSPGLNRLCEGFTYFFEHRHRELTALSQIPVHVLPVQH